VLCLYIRIVCATDDDVKRITGCEAGGSQTFFQRGQLLLFKVEETLIKRRKKKKKKTFKKN